MYKVQVECDKRCDVLLMSKDEIKTIRNNGAIVRDPDEKEDKSQLSFIQIQKLIKALESIMVKKDNCLAVNKLFYEEFSCYVDSVLFTLFAFSTKFVETHLLHPDMNVIEIRVRHTLLDGENLTEADVKKVMDYIKKINQILLQINSHFRGTDRMDYCRSLRPVLLKDPLMILQETPEYVFAKKKQEDAGELIQALFKTFFIDTIVSNNTKSFSNSKDKSIPDVISSIKFVPMAPFFVFTPDQLKGKEIELNKEYISHLDTDDYFFGNQLENSKFISNQHKVNGLKKLQLLSIVKLMIESLQKNKKITASSLSQFTNLVTLIKTNKNDEIIEKYTLENIQELYKFLRDISSTYYTNTLAPLIKSFKKDKSSVYYKAGEEIINSHTVYYDIFRETDNYQLEDDASKKLVIINVKRFEDLNKKDSRAIQIPTEIVISDVVLRLNQMIIHSGSSISNGHYTVRFRCNDKWYLYNDVGPEVTEVGTFEELISSENEFIKKNCSILVYSDIEPSI